MTPAGSGGATNTPNVKPIAMIATQADDDELEAARPAPGLHDEQHERDGAGDEAAPEQRDAEEQVEGDRAADDLGDVGRHGHELGLQPVRAAAQRLRMRPPEHLGQAPARDDAELRREVLDEPGHDVAEHDDPDEQVAVAGAGRHVARDVARIEVGDAGDERRTDQPRETTRGGRGRVPAPADVGAACQFSAYRNPTAIFGSPK